MTSNFTNKTIIPKTQTMFSMEGEEAYKRSLHSTIEDMIAMLETKNYIELISSYADPAIVSEFRQEGFEQKVADFGNSKSQELLTCLKIAATSQPEMNNTNTQAVFSHAIFSEDLCFELIDNKWYLKD